MAKQGRTWSGYEGIVSVLLVLLSLMAGSVQARNPDLSYSTLNLSESASTAELGEYDFAQEIAVVGTTVHVMWLTRNADWSGYKLYYRRSTDSGETWERKQLLFESDDMVYDNTYRRMAVSGNSVHLAVSHYEGSWYGVLTYLRSTNNGASFEAPRNIFTAGAVHHVYDVYVSAEGLSVTIGFRNQSNWQVNNSYILKVSEDNGANFVERVAYTTTSGNGWKVSDMQRVGDNIYVLYTDSYSYYGLQYSRLYVASASDGGANFNSTKISLPSNNGEDKTYTLQDQHYVPKIAGVGDAVSVIWSGLDADDVHSTFYRRSTDNGATWDTVQNLTAGLLPVGKALQAGLETLAAKGSYVYGVFVTTAANVYLRRSTTGGAAFLGLQELTAADTPFVSQGWWPVIETDPAVTNGSAVFVLWDYPTYVYSLDGGTTFTKPELITPYFSYGGAYASSAARPQMAVGPDSKLHCTVEAHYYANSFGGYGDMDIFYRGLSEPGSPAGVNKGLKLVSNSDDARYDNMQVPASMDLNFTSELTAEIWVKSHPGGVTTGTTSSIKPIFHKVEANYDFSYALQTWDRYGQRQAQAQIETTDGKFWVNPSSSIEGLVPDGVWTHLALTYDAEAGTENLKLYMNGRPIAAATATGNLATADGAFFAGRYGVWEVDELRLWAVARTQAAITADMNKALIGTEPGLSAYFNFNSSTKDITGRGNDGILMYREEFQDRDCWECLPNRGGWRAIVQ